MGEGGVLVLPTPRYFQAAFQAAPVPVCRIMGTGGSPVGTFQIPALVHMGPHVFHHAGKRLQILNRPQTAMYQLKNYYYLKKTMIAFKQYPFIL